MSSFTPIFTQELEQGKSMAAIDSRKRAGDIVESEVSVCDMILSEDSFWSRRASAVTIVILSIHAFR